MLPCHRPASSATLSRACPAVLGCTEADWGIQTHHAPEETCCFHPGCSPQLARRHGRPLRPPLLPRCRSSLSPGSVVEPVAGRTPSPSRPPPNLAASASARGPETGDPEREETAHWEMVTAPLPPPEEGRVEYLVFVPPLARSQRYPKLNLRAVSSVSGSREGESCELCITGSLPSSSLARQQVVAQEHPSCPFVEPGKGGSTPVPASSRYTSGCHKPQAGFLCFLPHEEESGECYTTHPDPAPAVTGQAVTGPGPGPCVPPRCPTAGTSVACWFRWHGVSEPG